MSNTPDVLSDGVADMGMGLLLAGARNIYQGKIVLQFLLFSFYED